MTGLESRFEAKFIPEPNSGCWLWVAGLNTGGYGCFHARTTDGFRTTIAHIVAYEALRGPVPDGLELDHLCRTRCCVNPDHLEPVTHAVNVQRGDAGKAGGRMRGDTMLARTHCPRGHEYTDANTYHNRGKRHCRACAALRQAGEREARRLYAIRWRAARKKT